MNASFVTAASKILDNKLTPVTVLTGSENILISFLKKHIETMFDEIEYYTQETFLSHLAFTAPIVPDTSKVIIIQDSSVLNIDWLALWLSKVKNVFLVFITQISSKFDNLSQSKVTCVLCEAPSGNKAQQKFVSMCEELFGFSYVHINLVLSQTNWNIPYCFNLFRQFKLLGLDLTQDNIKLSNNISDLPVKYFITSLESKNKLQAFNCISYVKETEDILLCLSDWARKLRVLKLSQTPFQSVYELAKSLNIDKSEAEKLKKQALKYSIAEIQQVEQVLLFLENYMYKDAALESLVSLWP